MLGWLRRNFATPAELKAAGVLGLNERNRACISALNPRSRFPLVDDKLQTKLLAQDYQLATPALLGVIRQQAEIAHFERFLPQQGGFAIKPAKGSGGKGILVIQHRSGDRYLKASGEWVSRQQIEHHLSNLISGLYSLGGHPDVAIIETLIRSHQAFEDFTFEGVPDIRVIVYRGYPVMAMMRLSTHASDGKANLHQGALGVGIDLGSGCALQAVQHDRPVHLHPDTGKPLSQLRISNWQYLLELASRCYDMTRLGYLGADLVVDAEHGPLLLELNARPGLAIQMANGTGLKPRLLKINRHCEGVRGPEEPFQLRVEVARRLFSGTVTASSVPEVCSGD
ncbi:alpha-L-glutamate ligase-like protein [Marinospirillum alkaliphilum]|uniref:Alpha-L-glutamate ligase-related protein n=1 Tax=Marinospirillum alkaliphilum DSM 21637 TaxID=1122209 RepID=A0A1K1XMN0_9GAMM|nr:alpha-L-glutamate ligase-like protein [Marinospirillum alkaliphilum]SFX50863.1 alpha-L-glutamate ligase-related protein [Marinospirillum alkaliphilum DSM 21637]